MFDWINFEIINDFFCYKSNFYINEVKASVLSKLAQNKISKYNWIRFTIKLKHKTIKTQQHVSPKTRSSGVSKNSINDKNDKKIEHETVC